MLEQVLEKFWETSMKEVEETEDFKPLFPVSKIKKIMKLDEEVRV